MNQTKKLKKKQKRTTWRRTNQASERHPACRGDAARVPYLAEEDGALGVHGVHDVPPRPHLLRAPNAGHVGVPSRRLRHRAGLRHQQRAPRRPLRVVRGVVRPRHVPVGPAPRQRRKNDPASVRTHTQGRSKLKGFAGSVHRRTRSIDENNSMDTNL